MNRALPEYSENHDESKKRKRTFAEGSPSTLGGSQQSYLPHSRMFLVSFYTNNFFITDILQASSLSILHLLAITAFQKSSFSKCHFSLLAFIVIHGVLDPTLPDAASSIDAALLPDSAECTQNLP
uniref:Uncharacterized protein n=1 Tax=Caenorhabditis japonica TaxID=281687 RepID=A0A8R1ETF8_CAEJA